MLKVMAAGLALVVAACSRVTAAVPEPTPAGAYVASQVLLQVHDPATVAAAATAIGGTTWLPSSIAGWYLVTLANGVSVDQAIARAQGNPLIERVEPNYTAAPL